MNITWNIEKTDIRLVKRIVEKHQNHPFVQNRIERNFSNKENICLPEFWHVLVACLLAFKERSGFDSPVTNFLNKKPFPFSHDVFISNGNIYNYTKRILNSIYGFKRPATIAGQLRTNFIRLRGGLWVKMDGLLKDLQSEESPEMERQVAEFIDTHFKGFGPMQSRNLLQSLGLTKFEIPVDTRIIKWLNESIFSLKFSAPDLSDRNFYNIVSDGFQHLCKQCGVYPCVLDAVVFASYDKGKWAGQNIVW